MRRSTLDPAAPSASRAPAGASVAASRRDWAAAAEAMRTARGWAAISAGPTTSGWAALAEAGAARSRGGLNPAAIAPPAAARPSDTLAKTATSTVTANATPGR